MQAETKRKELQGQASEAQPTTSTAAAAAAAAEASTLVASTSNLQALGFEQPRSCSLEVLVSMNHPWQLYAPHLRLQFLLLQPSACTSVGWWQF